MPDKIAKSRHYAQSGRKPRGTVRPRRRRVWYISPERFRDLRHSCLLNTKACAEYLGVSVRTVRCWETGRNRVPWSAVRLLRLLRCGDLGGLCDEWDGWTINRLGLHSPEGRTYRVSDMRHWWLQVERARLWQEAYDRGEIRGCGGKAPARPEAVTLLPEAGEAVPPPEVVTVRPVEAAPTMTAFLLFGMPVEVAGQEEPPHQAQPAPAPLARLPIGAVRVLKAEPCGAIEMASIWRHYSIPHAPALEASMSSKTALLSRLSAAPTGSAEVPPANRGPTKLNSYQSGVTLTSAQFSFRKGME